MGRLPAITGQDLLGQSKQLPTDLPVERIVIVAAFLRRHQIAADRWITALAKSGICDSPLYLKPETKSLVLEFPVMNPRARFFRKFIDGGMAASIKKAQILTRTWTFYTSVDDFCASTGIVDRKQIATLVCDRAGNILALTPGEITREKLDLILGAISQ